ncbi:DUF898 family protein [Jannaschia sp. 2305UL9-9]|uniref:DUF898 family protein n=1 Tax=Jannaschia sp. 2305UL9-9 TaxID=3121638 RepID=UPI00352917CF
MATGTTLDQMTAQVSGTRGQLLSLVARTTALTVMTLGVYSFWARTRVRRWLWSSVRIGGTPFEYAGQPLEKLMGFVIAAVIVAVYLGLVVMLLIFASLNIWGSPLPGTVASFLLVLPVYWFAQYRGMRYLLNHTRWRGIGFSMSPGAWRYAGLTVWWTLLALASVGLLWPLRVQRMWRFRAERAWYGDDHFRLTLTARGLFPPFIPVLIGLWSLAALIGAYFWTDDASFVTLSLMAGVYALFAWVHWRVVSYRRLVSSLGFAGAAGLTVAPKTGRVIGIHIGGWIVVALLLAAGAIAIGFGVGAAALSTLPGIDPSLLEEPDPYLLFAAGLLFYLTFFLGRGALRMVFVTFPLIRHVAETLHLRGAAEVNAVRAGERHHMHDADGFANLFDMGSGI